MQKGICIHAKGVADTEDRWSKGDLAYNVGSFVFCFLIYVVVKEVFLVSMQNCITNSYKIRITIYEGNQIWMN